MGPWGALVSGGLRADPASAVIKAAGGPYIQMIADLYQNTAGSAFQFLDMSEGNSEFLASKKGVQVLDFVRKYAMPSTFWTRMALERHVIEGTQKWIDPTGMKTRARAQIRRAKQVGAEFRKGYEPGSGTGSLPGLGGAL
jgi:hypothetical protein